MIEEQPITEALLRKLGRKRRQVFALRFAVLVAATSVLWAAYWFTRPPELVWWSSPPIGGTGLRVHTLVRSDMEETKPMGIKVEGLFQMHLWRPVDSRPKFLRRLLPKQQEKISMIQLIVEGQNPQTRSHGSANGGRTVLSDSTIYGAPFHRAERDIVRSGAGFQVRFYYCRSNGDAFRSNSQEICDSLKIE